MEHSSLSIVMERLSLEWNCAVLIKQKSTVNQSE